MSFQAVDAVLDATFPDMPAAPGRRYGVSRQILKLVAATVAYQIGCDGADAWPGLRRLARRSSSSIDTVRCAVHALVELGVLVLTVPSDGRRPDQYGLDVLALAGLVDRPSARATRALPTVGHPRASARATRALPRGGPARDSPVVHKSANDAVPTPPVRLAAQRPDDLAKQRVDAILADAARHSLRPQLFGERVAALVDERVAALLDDDQAVGER